MSLFYQDHRQVNIREGSQGFLWAIFTGYQDVTRTELQIFSLQRRSEHRTGRHQDDLRASRHHVLRQLSLASPRPDLDTLLKSDRRRGQEHFIGVQAIQPAQRIHPNQAHRAGRLVLAAQQDGLYPLPGRQLERHGYRIGDRSQVAPHQQITGQGAGSQIGKISAIENEVVSGRDQTGSGARDLFLDAIVCLKKCDEISRDIQPQAAQRRGDQPPMYAPHQPLPFELADIPPDGHLGDAEALAQLRYFQVAFFHERIQDFRPPGFCRECHVLST